jgi:hypothetical protein
VKPWFGLEPWYLSIFYYRFLCTHAQPSIAQVSPPLLLSWQATSPSLHNEKSVPPPSCTTLRANGVRQLSIYPEPEREIVVLDSPSVLETQIGVARRAVTGVVHDIHAQVHGVVSKWIDIEHAVERASCPLSLIPKNI